jgi:hypothetical protein
VVAIIGGGAGKYFFKYDYNYSLWEKPI